MYPLQAQGEHLFGRGFQETQVRKWVKERWGNEKAGEGFVKLAATVFKWCSFSLGILWESWTMPQNYSTSREGEAEAFIHQLSHTPSMGWGVYPQYFNLFMLVASSSWGTRESLQKESFSMGKTVLIALSPHQSNFSLSLPHFNKWHHNVVSSRSQNLAVIYSPFTFIKYFYHA